MFVFILFNFFAKLFKPEINKDAFYYLFVPAFGIFCYSFDAFFNFPTDRPEIQAIFALFIASGIAYSSGKVEDEIKIHVWIRRSIILILVILLSITSYILLLNFNSLKLQRLVKEDLLSGKLTHPASLFIEGFPSIPTISNSASPIAVYKSGYLINEGKYQEAIKLLRPDRSSPYDSWREYLMAEAFEKLGNPDSALVYAYKAHHLKPRYYTTLNFICIVLEAQGKQEEAISNMKSFLKLENKNRDAWLYLSSLYIKNNNPEMATLTIDSALINLPGDSSILHEKGRLNHAEEALPNQLILSKAMEYYKLNKFNEALFYLNKFIEKEQGVGIAYAGRAYCYFNFKNYSRCIEDINSSINLGNDTPDLMNLRGVCFHELGNSIAACKDFQNAAARGDKNAVKSLQQFCKGN
jgi:tetratricopeptide (TPR) repeat protein